MAWQSHGYGSGSSSVGLPRHPWGTSIFFFVHDRKLPLAAIRANRSRRTLPSRGSLSVQSRPACLASAGGSILAFAKRGQGFRIRVGGCSTFRLAEKEATYVEAEIVLDPHLGRSGRLGVEEAGPHDPNGSSPRRSSGLPAPFVARPRGAAVRREPPIRSGPARGPLPHEGLDPGGAAILVCQQGRADILVCQQALQRQTGMSAPRPGRLRL